MGYKMKENNIKHKLATILDLPKEVILQFPLISLIGNEEIVIQNHRGLIQYTSDIIRLKTIISIIKIEGKNLIIKKITSETIEIKGIVTSLTYEV